MTKRKALARVAMAGVLVLGAGAARISAPQSPGLDKAEALTQWFQVLSIAKDKANGKDLCLEVIGDYPKFTDCVSGRTTQQWMFGNYGSGQYIYNRYAGKVITYNGSGLLLSLTTFNGASKQLSVQGDPGDTSNNHIRPITNKAQCFQPTAWKTANVYITTAACDSYGNGIQGFWTRLAATS